MLRCTSFPFRRFLALVLLLALWVGGALVLQGPFGADAFDVSPVAGLALADHDAESERDVALPAAFFPVFLAAGPQERLERAEFSFADHAAPPDTPPPELG